MKDLSIHRFFVAHRAKMAARHVDVNERRLRPVYDALDTMNNKQAIQQADKILKKHKDLHCAKVLKSIALLRSGKVNECEKFMNEVKQVQPCDDSTLQAMTICYREMEKCSEISDIYEAALKKTPKNEELYTHLFMSYVRTSQYKKQQQVAMSLYKSFQKNPYYFWSIMSNVMQAYVCEDERLKTGMLFPLAERMIEKFIKEEKVEAEAEVSLYLVVLEMQEKYEKALEVLNGKLGCFLTGGSVNVKKKEVDYLSKLERWSEVNTCYKDMIQSSPDEWSFYLGYFDSLLMLIRTNYVPPDDDGNTARCIPDHNIAMAVEFINKLKKDELAKDGKRHRGPFLALLELLKQLNDNSLKDLMKDCNEDPLQLMAEHFKLFGDKNLCCSDLVMYLDLIDGNEAVEFLDLCKSCISTPDESNVKENIKTMSRIISVEKMSRYLGNHQRLSQDDKISLAKHCMALHKDGLKYGKDLLPTDFQYSDDHALLASHLLLDCCEKSDNSNPWLRVLIVLESALKSSPSNFQFKLLVSRVYCFVGAVGPCVTYMDGMEVKHIAHDTLGHNITRYAEPLGHFESAMAVYNLALKLYHSNKKDTPEYIIASYKYGSFEKIFELINFMGRLENSFTYASVLYEQQFLEIILLANSSSSIQELFVDKKIEECCRHLGNWTEKLRDNRDLDVLESWNRSDRHSLKGMKKTSFKHETLWLKLRVLIIRALDLAVSLLSTGNVPVAMDTMVNHHVSSSSQNTNGSPDIDTSAPFTAMSRELEDIFNEADSSGVKYIEFSIFGPLPTRWKLFLDASYHQLLLCLLNVSQEFKNLTEQPQDEKLRESVEVIKSDFSTTTRILTDNVTMCLERLTVEDKEKKIFNGKVIEPLVLLVEAISIVLVFVASFRSIVIKISQISRSKKKKKVLSPAKKELSETFKSFVESLNSQCSSLYNRLLDEQTLHLTEELLMFDMNELYRQTDSSLSTEIWEKIQSSYKISVQEINAVMKHKIEFLKELSI